MPEFVPPAAPPAPKVAPAEPLNVKPGDRVRVHGFAGQRAIVLAVVLEPGKPVAVEFAAPILAGHTCDGRGEDGRCWWVRPDEIDEVAS